MLAIGTGCRRRASEQYVGADGARRPGCVHPAAATNIVCKSDNLEEADDPVVRGI